MNIPAIHSWILKYCLPWVKYFSLARNYLSNEHHENKIEAPGRITGEKMQMHDFGHSCDFQSAVSPLLFVQSFWKFGWTLVKIRSLLTRKIKVKTQSSFFIFGSSFHSFRNQHPYSDEKCWVLFGPCPAMTERCKKRVSGLVSGCPCDHGDIWHLRWAGWAIIQRFSQIPACDLGFLWLVSCNTIKRSHTTSKIMVSSIKWANLRLIMLF